MRIPLIARWPGLTLAGETCDEPVIGIDLLPTLSRALALDVDASSLDGVDLRPLLQQPSASLDRNALFWHYPHYHSGATGPHSVIRSGHWKLIERHEDGRLELYNLAKDPEEVWEVSSRFPVKAAELADRLAKWRTSVGAQMPLSNPDYEPARASMSRWVITAEHGDND